MLAVQARADRKLATQGLVQWASCTQLPMGTASWCSRLTRTWPCKATAAQLCLSPQPQGSGLAARRLPLQQLGLGRRQGCSSDVAVWLRSSDVS